MYNESSFRIKCNGNFSSPIPCKLGVKQGCNLSPLLFNLFINDIHDIFEQSCTPVEIEKNKFSSLSFADDLVLLAESQAGLQNCLIKLEKYCLDWGLKVNLTKTNVVVFNKTFNKTIKSLNFTFEGTPIEIHKSYCYLGIEISNTGNFAKAMDSLYKKSLRALYSLYSTLNVYSDGNNIQLFLTLFDSLVKPILLYGCEIWGPNALSTSNNPLNKLVNKFYRTLLGVPKHCSTIGTHVELACFPLSINIKYSMLNYWCRLTTLPKSRLVSHCYWSLLNLKNVNDKWLISIKDIIKSTGQRNFNFLWKSQDALHRINPKSILSCKRQIREMLKNEFLSTAVDEMNSQIKLLYFKDSKTEFTLSRYLSILPTRNSRSLLCKLRLGVFNLEVETGRKVKIDQNGAKIRLERAERVCKLCNSGEVEDETHFLFSCEALSQTRDAFLNPLFLMCPDLSGASHLDKLMYLYFNENLEAQETYLATNLLIQLKNARDNITISPH